MKPEEILRIVDAIHRDKNIDKEIVFQAIEAALVTALTRQYGETSQVTISIDRADGTVSVTVDSAVAKALQGHTDHRYQVSAEAAGFSAQAKIVPLVPRLTVTIAGRIFPVPMAAIMLSPPPALTNTSGCKPSCFAVDACNVPAG